VRLWVFDRFFHKNQNAPPEVQHAYMAALAQGEASRSSEADVSREEQLGTNNELLHDKAVEAMLEEEMYQRIVYETTDSKGNPAYGVMRGDLNYDMAAIRMILSHVNRASFLNPAEADIMKVRIRAMVKMIKLSTPPDRFNLGFANFLRSIEINCNFLINDAEGGRKGKLLKTVPRISQIELRHEQVKAE
jgi:hypothetical protein